MMSARGGPGIRCGRRRRCSERSRLSDAQDALAMLAPCPQCQEHREPVVPNFRALPLVRVLTAGGSGAGRADGWRPAVVGAPAAGPAARCGPL
jgi:hypothetical protein